MHTRSGRDPGTRWFITALALVILGAEPALAEPPPDASIEVVVQFSPGNNVRTRVGEDELGELTGQKLPYVIGNWMRAGLHKLHLPFVENATGIVAIRGVANGSSGRWVCRVDGVRVSSPIDSHLSDAVRVLTLTFEPATGTSN